MSENKNRFKALLSSDDNKNSNKFLNSNKKWKGDRNNNNVNDRWKNLNDEKKNVFHSRRNNRGRGRGRGRRFFGRNRVTPMNNDPNFKPNLVGRGEVSFTPQVKSVNKIQKNKKKDKLKPLIKKEEVEDKISEEELKLTLALAEKYQYFTESEEEGEEGEEGEVLESWSSDEGGNIKEVIHNKLPLKDNSAW